MTQVVTGLCRGLRSVLGQSCDIHGGKKWHGDKLSPFNIIVPMLHSHLDIHVAVSRKTDRQSLQNCHKAVLFWRSGSTGYKVTFSVLQKVKYMFLGMHYVL